MPDDLIEYILRMALVRAEVAGPSGPFGVVLDALSGRGIRLGVLFSESLVCAPTITRDCADPMSPDPCAACLASFETHWGPNGVGRDLSHIAQHEAGRMPDLIVPTDAMSQEMAADLANTVFRGREVLPFEAPRPPALRRSGRPLLAMLLDHRDQTAETFMMALVAGGLRRGSAWVFLVVGEPVQARALMSAGTLFVTGPSDGKDWAEALDHYEAAAVCAPQRWSGYGPLERVTRDRGLPKAYFDWSMGALPLREPDLSLDPRLCDQKAAARLLDWLEAGFAEAAA
jgi:hypothetical protein